MRLLLADTFGASVLRSTNVKNGMAALEAALAGRFDCFIFERFDARASSGLDLLKRVGDRGIQTRRSF
jgi:hypothetical protein